MAKRNEQVYSTNLHLLEISHYFPNIRLHVTLMSSHQLGEKSTQAFWEFPLLSPLVHSLFFVPLQMPSNRILAGFLTPIDGSSALKPKEDPLVKTLLLPTSPDYSLPLSAFMCWWCLLVPPIFHAFAHAVPSARGDLPMYLQLPNIKSAYHGDYTFWCHTAEVQVLVLPLTSWVTLAKPFNLLYCDSFICEMKRQ